MTLLETIGIIERVASSQPSVNSIVRNDIFRLNSLPNAKYGVFGWTQGAHRMDVDTPFCSFVFTFFYIDRLVADKSNELEIQSVGIQTLTNILRTLEDRGIYADASYTFQTFNQRFADECAGVFCNISLAVAVDGYCVDSGLDIGGVNTLRGTIRAVELIASRHPAINMIVRNDVFRLNAIPNARYGVFAWTQGMHNASPDSQFTNFVFTFFYVDRLTNDKGNELEIQSFGIQVLTDIVRTLDDNGIFTDVAYTFQAFDQRFADECAGVYCNVTLSVPVDGNCPETWADYNADFNEDFLIY